MASQQTVFVIHPVVWTTAVCSGFADHAVQPAASQMCWLLDLVARYSEGLVLSVMRTFFEAVQVYTFVSSWHWFGTHLVAAAWQLLCPIATAV